MPLFDADDFLINNGIVTETVSFENLKSGLFLNDSDLILINDGLKTETITYAQFKDGTFLNNTDTFLVNNGIKTETVTWSEIQGSLSSPPVIRSVTLVADDTSGDRFTNQSFTTRVGMDEDGKPPSTKSIRGQVYSEVLRSPESDEIINVIEVTPGNVVTGETAIINLYFASDKDFDLFEIGDVISQSDYKAVAEIVGIYPDEFADPILQVSNINIAFEDWNVYNPSNIKRSGTPEKMWDGLLGKDNNSRGNFNPQKDLAGSYTWAPPNGYPATSSIIVHYKAGGSPTDKNQWRIIDTDGNVGAWTTVNTSNGDFSPSVPFPTPYNGMIGRLEALTTGSPHNNFRPDGETTGSYNRLQPYGVEIDGDLLVNSSSVWGPANTGLYAIGSLIAAEAVQYLNLDNDLNVTGLQPAEPDFTPFTGNAAQIKFGSSLGTADTPDVVLPDGASIQTEVKASNGVNPDSIKESNTITPQPCVSGPINTDEIIAVSSDGLTLTFDGANDLTKFVPDQVILQNNATEVGTLIGYTIRNSKVFKDTWDNVGPDIEEVVAGQIPNYVGSDQYAYLKLDVSAKAIIAKDLDRNSSTPKIKLWGSNDEGRTWTLACSEIPVGNPGESNVISDAEYRYYFISGGTDSTQGNPHLFFIDNTPTLVLQPQGIVGSVRYIGDSSGSTANEITLNTTSGAWGPDNTGLYAEGYYECPSTYTPLYIQNPEDVAKFNVIKEALESHEYNVRQYRANLTNNLY